MGLTMKMDKYLPAGNGRRHYSGRSSERPDRYQQSPLRKKYQSKSIVWTYPGLSLIHI